MPGTGPPLSETSSQGQSSTPVGTMSNPNHDTILPVNYKSEASFPYREQEQDAYNSPMPVRDLPPSRDSDDKLGEREKNSDGGVDVGRAPPVDEFSATSSEQYGNGRFAGLRRHRRPLIHLFILLLFTGWWIASLILHRNDKNWVVPFLLWLAITLRIITFYIPATYVSRPIAWVWQHTAVPIANMVPERLRTIAGAAVAIAAIVVGAMASEETADNTRANRAISLLGLAVILAGFWATSRHRRAVK